MTVPQIAQALDVERGRVDSSVSQMLTYGKLVRTGKRGAFTYFMPSVSSVSLEQPVVPEIAEPSSEDFPTPIKVTPTPETPPSWGDYPKPEALIEPPKLASEDALDAVMQSFVRADNERLELLDELNALPTELRFCSRVIATLEGFDKSVKIAILHAALVFVEAQ
jgi:hypothetical protein